MLRSPVRLTALMVLCSLLAATGFLVLSSSPAVHTHPFLLAACFACVLLGYLGMLWTGSTLRNNVQSDRWPAETLAPFQRVLNHVLWKIGVGLLFLGLVAALMVQGRHHTSWFWAVFVLLQAQTQITNAFTDPRTPPGTGAYTDWSAAAPLHSEHWGER